jgi:outer membrane protein assembly factor BamB
MMESPTLSPDKAAPQRRSPVRHGLLGVAVVLVGIVVFHLSKSRKESRPSLEVAAGEADDDLPPAEVSATDWPWWGGPTRDNRSGDREGPTTWSETTGIAWKKAIPGLGHSTPIVVDDQIVLTTADETRQEQLVISLDRITGAQRWQTVVHQGGFMTKHASNSYASATPASDGSHIFVTFLNHGALVVTSLDLAGTILWQTEAVPFASEHGDGPSPVIYKSWLIVNGDNSREGYLAALHRGTGRLVWRKARRPYASYGTPIVHRVAGRDQLLIHGTGTVASYDPRTGEILWTFGREVNVAANTLAAGSSMVFASCRTETTALLAIRADGAGDVTETHLAWDWRKKNDVPSCPSLLLHSGFLYAVSDSGFCSCYNAETGEQRWSERLQGQFWASPVLVGDTIYAANQSGQTYVFKADPDELVLVAKNRLDEGVNASPVIAGGRLYLRSASFLYCISGSHLR